MANETAFERVQSFLHESKTWPSEVVATRVKDIEDDIYSLFRTLESLHNKYPELKPVELSPDFLALVRMLEHGKVKQQFPLLARLAAMI